jgi:1-acyl-sn-glycerol-3-phosphate acyltransferase
MTLATEGEVGRPASATTTSATAPTPATAPTGELAPAEVTERVLAQPLPPLPPPGTRERGVLDALVGLVERSYGEDIERRVSTLNTQTNEAGFDPFGFDPEVARYVLALVTFFHRSYFRTEVHGVDQVPIGRAVLVANHSGHLPIDGILIAAALVMDRERPILARAMVEKWAQRLPFVSVLFTRVGQVLGAPDNARRLLEADHPLLVFPEGIRGISKHYRDRYKLADFGLGFMRLALETKAPIVPIAVIGGEEQYPALGNFKGLAKLLKMPVFPLIPQVLLGMPVPLPTKYRLYFGEPMMFEGDPDEDDGDIKARVEGVRESIQSMLARGLAARKHVFW